MQFLCIYFQRPVHNALNTMIQMQTLSICTHATKVSTTKMKIKKIVNAKNRFVEKITCEIYRV